MEDNVFIQVASSIGEKLTKRAFWHNSRCNWVDRSIDDLIQTGSIASRALPPNIYDGTSGIALFLSNLYAFDRKEVFKRTAEGALNQALYKVKEMPKDIFGLHSGITGIAYASAVVGKDLNNDKFIDESVEIVKRFYEDKPKYDLLDIISGIAGAIVALIKVYEISREEHALDLAEEMGNELIESAIKEHYGWSWDYKGSGLESAMHNLTGFSHGAAGIAYALLVLYNITENKRYLEGARNAFRYEDYWFSKENDNWPDFRIDEDKPNKEPSFMVAWCHGAPGISVSRLYAYKILGDEEYLDDINASIRSMKRMISGINNTNYPNFSLCHGFAGIGDILLYAEEVLNDSSLSSLASKIGYYGIEKFAGTNAQWPCDNRVGELLGFMLGIAGIGNFYLRLLSKSIPTVLIPI